ncbi:MAG: hypothetical protein AAF675_07520 [Pseudomonadota bacterium]
MTNFEKLLEAGAIADPADVSDHHKEIINNEFTAEEIAGLIKLKDKVTGKNFASNPESGGAAV